jgi:hypothetical protein
MNKFITQFEGIPIELFCLRTREGVRSYYQNLYKGKFSTGVIDAIADDSFNKMMLRKLELTKEQHPIIDFMKLFSVTEDIQCPRELKEFAKITGLSPQLLIQTLT